LSLILLFAPVPFYKPIYKFNQHHFGPFFPAAP
jgi:hypothetical protein